MSETIEQKCIAKGVKLTDQRKIIAKVMSNSEDHPDVNELYLRVSKLDSKISIATVYRTVKLFEEAGIITKHDFKGGKARYEEVSESHHDHLIDIKTGEIIEFVDEDIEILQKKVASVGFEYRNDLEALKKVYEELEELKIEVLAKNKKKIKEELGDLIFATLDVSRKLKLNPEIILKKANNKFSKRWKKLEKNAKKEKLNLNKLSLKKYDLLCFI